MKPSRFSTALKMESTIEKRETAATKIPAMRLSGADWGSSPEADVFVLQANAFERPLLVALVAGGGGR